MCTLPNAHTWTCGTFWMRWWAGVEVSQRHLSVVLQVHISVQWNKPPKNTFKISRKKGQTLFTASSTRRSVFLVTTKSTRWIAIPLERWEDPKAQACGLACLSASPNMSNSIMSCSEDSLKTGHSAWMTGRCAGLGLQTTWAWRVWHDPWRGLASPMRTAGRKGLINWFWT